MQAAEDRKLAAAMLSSSYAEPAALWYLQSNAITVAKGGRLLGMGSGQPNRVNSVRIALEKAADEVEVRISAMRSTQGLNTGSKGYAVKSVLTALETAAADEVDTHGYVHASLCSAE